MDTPSINSAIHPASVNLKWFPLQVTEEKKSDDPTLKIKHSLRKDAPKSGLSGKVLSRRGCNMSPVRNWEGAFHAPHVINSLLERVNTPQVVWLTADTLSVHILSPLCAGHSLQPLPTQSSLPVLFFHPAWQKVSLLFLLLWLHYRCFLSKNTSAVNTAINRATTCLPDYNYWLFAAGHEPAWSGLSDWGAAVCLHWHNVRAINACATLHKWSSTLDSNWIKHSVWRSHLCSASWIKINILISKSPAWDTSPG